MNPPSIIRLFTRLEQTLRSVVDRIDRIYNQQLKGIMPTKLKKPITITFDHVENAVEVAAKSRAEHCDGAWDWSNPRHRKIYECHAIDEVFSQIKKALAAQGINWETWEPPQPIYIAGCEADFKSNGDVRLGSETLDRATLVEVLKRSDEAMGEHSEGEWPRYFRSHKNGFIYKCEDETCTGFYCKIGSPVWRESGGERLADYVAINSSNWTSLTRAEASAILGRKV